MYFEWFVSRRYLRAKRKQKFISLISVISVLGVAVGVLALIVVLSVYTGFTEGLRDQIIGINAHVLVQRYGSIEEPAAVIKEIEAVPEVVAATPNIYGQALISSGSVSTGVVLRGIEPASAVKVIGIEAKMREGSLWDLEARQGLPAIILGQELAQQLGVHLGEKIRLISPSGALTPMGVLPGIRTCRVAGIFKTGMYEYDSTMGYIGLALARSLTGLEGDDVHGIEVRVREVDGADHAARTIKNKLEPGYSVRDWMQINQNLFAALKLEKAGIFIALDLIILVAALNIVSALVMVVMEKTRDIAILKAMGASTGQIMRIFFFQGAVIGLTGTLLGLGGGLGLCSLLSRYQLIELPSNVYPMSTLPVKVVPLDVSLVAVSAVLITLLATLYPSWRASRVKPAESLTYE